MSLDKNGRQSLGRGELCALLAALISLRVRRFYLGPNSNPEPRTPNLNLNLNLNLNKNRDVRRGNRELHLYSDRTAHARPANPAVSVGILVKVLLVIILGVVEGRRIGDLCRDTAESRVGEAVLERGT
jgi:hypothetical protein